MLGLATHEPHFYILREEVLPGGGPRKPDEEYVVQEREVSMKPFQFLCISILREYLRGEFYELERLPLYGINRLLIR